MRKLFLILALLMVTHVAIGQQQTAYQKKVYALTIQFFRKLGVDESLLKKSNKLSDLENLFLAADMMNRLNTERGIMLLLAYQREIKEAEKLKTSIDFQRDKEKKEKEQQTAKLKEIENQKKLALLEKERLEKERIEKYNNSDFVYLNNKISQEFNSWVKKGEFEKTEDYEKRKKGDAQTNFEKISYEVIQNRIDQRQNNYDGNTFDFKLKDYNADKEEFGIEISFRNLKWNDVIKVAISKAPTFKENFTIQDVAFKKWGIYENELYPEIIVATESESKRQIEFRIPVTTLNDFKISTSKISATPYDNIEFSLWDYQQKFEKEKEALAIKQKQDEEDRKRKEAEESEKKERQIAKEKQEREALRIKEEGRRAFEASDYGQLRRAIKTEFTAWLEKKELETQQQFEARIKNNYLSEFKKVVEAKIQESKYSFTNSKFFAKLGAYNSDSETFKIEFDRSSSYLKSNEFRTSFRAVFDADISINIPQNLAGNLKSNFSSSYGNAVLAYVLDVQMQNNSWIPSKIIFVFPNDNSTGVDAYSRNDLHVEQKDDDKYVLAFARNYSYKPVKLKNISSQFKDSSLDKGVFYTLSQKQVETNTTLDFTIENLEIKLPF